MRERTPPSNLLTVKLVWLVRKVRFKPGGGVESTQVTDSAFRSSPRTRTAGRTMVQNWDTRAKRRKKAGSREGRRRRGNLVRCGRRSASLCGIGREPEERHERRGSVTGRLLFGPVERESSTAEAVRKLIEVPPVGEQRLRAFANAEPEFTPCSVRTLCFQGRVLGEYDRLAGESHHSRGKQTLRGVDLQPGSGPERGLW